MSCLSKARESRRVSGASAAAMLSCKKVATTLVLARPWERMGQSATRLHKARFPYYSMRVRDILFGWRVDRAALAQGSPEVGT